VTADTWGTEVGVLSKRRTYLVTTWRPVSPGVNGGVSFAGLLGAFLGAALIALVGLFWHPDPLLAAVVAAAGFLGGVADSMLGATLQASYRCPVCGKVTEKREHCHRGPSEGLQPAAPELVRGLRWMGNDAVNWLCAGTGAFVMALLRWF
jgi:uncharacterized membrane protein